MGQQQLYLNQDGVKTLLELLAGKIDELGHLNYEVVLTDDESQTIQQVVTQPEGQTIYLFKAGSTQTTYKMYMCEVTPDASGGAAVNWLPIGESSVDLSNYYSKSELVAMTSEKITEIFSDVFGTTS